MFCFFTCHPGTLKSKARIDQDAAATEGDCNGRRAEQKRTKRKPGRLVFEYLVFAIETSGFHARPLFLKVMGWAGIYTHISYIYFHNYTYIDIQSSQYQIKHIFMYA